MKKIIALICVVLLIVIGLFIFNNVSVQNVEEQVFNGLNGVVLPTESDKRVIDFINEYQENNFVSGEDYYILCNNAEKFDDYCEKSEEIDKLLQEDPFTVIENTDIYDPYYDDVSIFYNFITEGIEDTNADFLEVVDNKYCIKYKNLNFGKEGYMVIRKGRFIATVLEREITKALKEEAEAGQYVNRVGKEKTENGMSYYYYDTLNKKEIVVEIDMNFGILNNLYYHY